MPKLHSIKGKTPVIDIGNTRLDYQKFAVGIQENSKQNASVLRTICDAANQATHIYFGIGLGIYLNSGMFRHGTDSHRAETISHY